jgi:hypothetical protein
MERNRRAAAVGSKWEELNRCRPLAWPFQRWNPCCELPVPTSVPLRLWKHPQQLQSTWEIVFSFPIRRGTCIGWNPAGASQPKRQTPDAGTTVVRLACFGGLCAWVCRGPWFSFGCRLLCVSCLLAVAGWGLYVLVSPWNEMFFHLFQNKNKNKSNRRYQVTCLQSPHSTRWVQKAPTTQFSHCSYTTSISFLKTFLLRSATV